MIISCQLHSDAIFCLCACSIFVAQNAPWFVRELKVLQPVTHMLSLGHMADMCATHRPSEYDKPQQIRISNRAVLVIR